MDNLKEYEKVAKFYERADKIYNRLVKAMFEGEVGGLDTSTVLHLESGFLYQDTIDANYPQRDFHTMYVGKIEKVLVRDDEYLNN